MPRILVYKRTHPHDPGVGGVFGNQDCMGQVRGFNYGVVVGIGGIGAEARSHGIDRRLNWIGIEPIPGPVHPNRNHPTFTFTHFVLRSTRVPSSICTARDWQRRCTTAVAVFVSITLPSTCRS